ncbi:energy transducer TonB [Pontibacter sp. HSC-36F09]|uniref:energy transducer TonB n=1 Tax=Pontibacter sp. HSC-36F09 TaxID=2910966 RepID=UPI0020A1C556|nr:energy transducer TonB [Pontibacter sp. HSC-36F09]MCP2042573.1 antitoxin component YwqK of YwqJK toxin-antitoxin module [Pontibacter sp. HSC-36F09]
MKQTLLAVLLLFLMVPAFAQQNEEPEYKGVILHYNADWQITSPEEAVAKRLTYFSTDVREMQHLSAPLFQHVVTDYYADNTVMAKGYYNAQGKKWGKWVFYHPNGQVDCEGNFSENVPTGNWKFWSASGTPLADVTLNGEEMRVNNLWSETGNQLVKDGQGEYKAPFAAANGKGTSILEGMFVDGYKTGWWRLTDASGKMELEQIYDSKGKILSGTIYVNGVPTISKDDLMHLVSLPDYLFYIEQWRTDPKYYAAKYPVAADLLGCQITKVDLPQSDVAPADYYFQVVQRRSNGEVDTLQYGVPVIEASFKGDLFEYTKKNFKGPSSTYMGRNKIEGLLMISFTVMEDGQVKDATVKKSVHPKVDEEGLRFVNSMPAWNPATRLGKPIASEMILPIRFSVRTQHVQPPSPRMPDPFSNIYRW